MEKVKVNRLPFLLSRNVKRKSSLNEEPKQTSSVTTVPAGLELSRELFILEQLAAYVSRTRINSSFHVLFNPRPE